jgi:hypothetical protein
VLLERLANHIRKRQSRAKADSSSVTGGRHQQVVRFDHAPRGLGQQIGSPACDARQRYYTLPSDL